MARCAACRSEFVGREPIRYVEEYIVHPGCVGLPIRAKTELAEKSALVERLQKSVRDQQALVESAENAERTTRIAHDHVSRELATTRAELASEKSRRTSLEFQLEITRGRPPTPAITPDQESEGSPPSDGKADLEARVSLLELT